MPTTPIMQLPYPAASDPADVPTDMGELATRIEAVRGGVNGLASLDAAGKVPAAQLPPSSGGIPPSIVDAKGDLIVASAPDVVARLGIGTDGQALVADAAAALGLKWATPAGGVPPTTGHEGDYLKVVGGTPAWAVAAFVALAAYAAKGQLLAASGPSSPVAINPGTDGQVLTADFAQPAGVKWATPAGAAPAFSGARVYRSAALAVTAGSWAVVPFDAEDFDTQAYHDNVTNPSRITIPLTGYYLLVAHAPTAITSGSNYGLRFLLNGTTAFARTAQFSASTSVNVAPSTSAIRHFAAGDYVEVQTFMVNAGNFEVGPDATTCAITRLGT